MTTKVDKCKFLFRFPAIPANLNLHASASETIETTEKIKQQGIGVGHILRDRAVHRDAGREIWADAASARSFQAEAAECQQ